MTTLDSLDDLFSLLLEQSALIVHCAGFAKGVGSGATDQLAYLERLRFAIDNADIELSCSTITPGDVHNLERMNYTGYAGIVLRPNKTDSITFASSTDAGSQIDPRNSKRRITNLPPATLELTRSAILDRPVDRYNELGVIDYTVLGVFVDPPVEYSTSDGTETIEISQIASTFRDQRLFCLRAGTLYELRWDGANPSLGSEVDMWSLYAR